MNLWIVVCFAVAVAGYQDRKSNDAHPKEHYHKLKDSTGTGVFPADFKYYHAKNGDAYAMIKCKSNPDSEKLTIIVTESDDHIEYFPLLKISGLTGFVPLAAGNSPTLAVKYHKNGKWTAKDLFFYKQRKFRSVGCFFSDEYQYTNQYFS